MANPAETKFEIAERLRDEGRFQESISVVRSLQDECEHPEDKAQLLVFEAAVLMLSGDNAGARSVLARALSLQPDNEMIATGIMHEEARLDRAEGHVADGLVKIEYLIKNHSHPEWNDTLQMERGLMLAELTRYQEALPILEEAVRKGRNNYQVLYYLGTSYLALRRFEDAIEPLTRALGDRGLSERLHPYALLARGVSYHEKENYSAALRDLEACNRISLHLDPTSLKTLSRILNSCVQALGIRNPTN